MRYTPAVRSMFLFVGLMAFWLTLSGYFDALHIGFGLFSAALVMLLFGRIRNHLFFPQEGPAAEVKLGRSLAYIIWLIVQIFKSGFYVAGVIIKPRMPIEPSILTFKTDLPGPTARMILGNSITLTPGTLTVDIQGDVFTVHALTPATFEGIVDDSMPKQVLRLFSDEDRPVVSEVSFVHTNEPRKGW